MVNLTIDGKALSVPEGTSILEAALQHGIYIPHLCYHPWVGPIESCRLCVVEVEGAARPVPACATPVTEGMVVRTDSDRLRRLRREALQLIVANHPLDCPVCDKAGECELQRLVYELEITDVPYRPAPPEERIDYASPLMERYGTRCVRCGRCVKVCQERQGVGALVFVGSGYATRVDTPDGGPLSCEFCGQCMAVCPVGAILSKPFKFKSRVWFLEKHAGVCPYCGAGCALEWNTRQERVLRVTSDPLSHSQGDLCGRGRFGYEFYERERLEAPLRQGRECDLEEALDLIASRLREVISQWGPQGVGLLGSTGLTNEDAYVLQRFAREVLRTNNVDVVDPYGYGRALRALEAVLGHPGGTAVLEDLEGAGSILVLGSDLKRDMPVAAVRALRAARQGDAVLVVAAPCGTALDRFATHRMLHRPGSEGWLLVGLMKAMGEVPQELAPLVEGRSWEEIEERTGVPRADVQRAAEAFRSAAPRVMLLGPMLYGQLEGEQTVTLAADLAVISGAKVLPLAVRANAQGAFDVGCAPDRLPGHRSLGAAAELPWEVPPEEGRGTAQVLEAIEGGRIRALYLMGCDPLLELPEGERWEAALGKLELLVVQDAFRTEAVRRAHVAIPMAVAAEVSGSFTSCERRVQAWRRAVPSPGRPGWWVLDQLAHRLGRGWGYEDARNVQDELIRDVPFYRWGEVWRVEDGGGGARAAQPPEPPGGPFRLLLGDAPLHNGLLSSRCPALRSVVPGPYLGMNPEDARSLGVSEGQEVTVISTGAQLRVPVRPCEELPPGTLFLPVNFPELPAWRLSRGGVLCSVEVKRG